MSQQPQQKKEMSSAQRSFMTLTQQLAGAESAALNRPLRVPEKMWRRGGKRKDTTPDVTHYEAAYRSFAAGRAHAIANENPTVHELRSTWFSFGYYSTLSVLDIVGGRINEISTDVKNARPASEALGVRPEPLPAAPAKPSPKWYTPGHSIKYAGDMFNELEKTITVSDDGKRLVAESLKQRRGEPIFCDSVMIGHETALWAQYYRREAQKAGVTK